MAAPRPSWAAAGGGAASFSGISGDLIADSSSLSLSEEVSAGLTALGRLGSPAAGLVVDAAWAALLTPTTTGSSIASTLERDSRVGAGEAAKLAASGILALLLEAARLAAAPDAVRSVPFT